MNIVFFIGNGFDINLGMKTRYSDFYKYYKDVASKSIAIEELKKEIAEGIVNWSDLELAFGKYTVKLKDLKEFDEIYEDIVDNLADYLIEEENKTDLKKVNSDKFFKDLYSPEIYLANEDFQELRAYRNNWSTNAWNLSIITLNYTRSIERIMGKDMEDSSIGSHEHGHNVYFRRIHHIHGYTDNRLVLGLNDVSQLDNVDFHDKEEIIESIIKIKCNQAQRHNVDKACERLLNNATLICIFGSSIGDTDNHWWQLIGEQLRKNCRIIIFSRGEDIKERFAQKAVRTKRAIKKLFFQKTDLSSDEIKEYEGNVYVGINTNLFNII